MFGGKKKSNIMKNIDKDKLINELRIECCLGKKDCEKALINSEWNFNKAIEWLRKNKKNYFYPLND